jgi:hypothetical protein
MSSERLIMQGRLKELQEQRVEAMSEAAGLIETLRALILPAAVVPLAQLNADHVVKQAQNLKTARDRYLDAAEKIAAIEKEL